MHRIWRSTRQAASWIGGIEFDRIPGTMRRVKRRRWIIVGRVTLLCLIGVVVGAWLSTREPVFQGKTESEWIAEILSIQQSWDPSDQRLVRISEMGPDFAGFLGHALDRRNSRTEGLYLSLYRNFPRLIARWLPQPTYHRMDRQAILWVLGRMGASALPAEPAIGRCLRDQDWGTSGAAVLIYAGSDRNSLVPSFDGGLFAVMDKESRERRLPDFVVALATAGNPTTWVPTKTPWNIVSSTVDGRIQTDLLRILGSYSGHARSIVPVLTNWISHSNWMIQAAACQALVQVDRDAAVQAGVVEIAVGMLEAPRSSGPGSFDAYRFRRNGAELLGELGAKPEVSLPPLIQAAFNEPDNDVAAAAINALGSFRGESN
jgi:hypothetical protein